MQLRPVLDVTGPGLQEFDLTSRDVTKPFGQAARGTITYRAERPLLERQEFLKPTDTEQLTFQVHFLCQDDADLEQGSVRPCRRLIRRGTLA